jgi:hypothetical protein
MKNHLSVTVSSPGIKEHRLSKCWIPMTIDTGAICYVAIRALSLAARFCEILLLPCVVDSSSIRTCPCTSAGPVRCDAACVAVHIRLAGARRAWIGGVGAIQATCT